MPLGEGGEGFADELDRNEEAPEMAGAPAGNRKGCEMIGFPNLTAWTAENNFRRVPPEVEAPEEVEFIGPEGETLIVMQDGATLFDPDFSHSCAVRRREGGIFKYGSLSGDLKQSFIAAVYEDLS